MVSERNFWSLRKAKKYLTPCTRQLMRRKTIVSACGCPDALEELTTEVYYSDFAQQTMKNVAVLD